MDTCIYYIYINIYTERLRGQVLASLPLYPHRKRVLSLSLRETDILVPRNCVFFKPENQQCSHLCPLAFETGV